MIRDMERRLANKISSLTFDVFMAIEYRTPPSLALRLQHSWLGDASSLVENCFAPRGNRSCPVRVPFSSSSPFSCAPVVGSRCQPHPTFLFCTRVRCSVEMHPSSNNEAIGHE